MSLNYNIDAGGERVLAGYCVFVSRGQYIRYDMRNTAVVKPIFMRLLIPSQLILERLCNINFAALLLCCPKILQIGKVYENIGDRATKQF